jgi:hypothetical protein
MSTTTVQPSMPATMTRQEQQMMQHLLPVLAATHTYPVALQAPLTRPTVQVIDGTVWEFTPLSNTDPTPLVIPPVASERLAALEEQGIHFSQFVWGEERGQEQRRPNFVSYAEEQPRRERAFPVSSDPRMRTHSAAELAAKAAKRAAKAAKRLDPILLGYLPLTSERGVLILLSNWKH